MKKIECMNMIKPGVCKLTLNDGIHGGACWSGFCALAQKAKANNLTVVPPSPETINFVNHYARQAG